MLGRFRQLDCACTGFQIARLWLDVLRGSTVAFWPSSTSGLDVASVAGRLKAPFRWLSHCRVVLVHVKVQLWRRTCSAELWLVFVWGHACMKPYLRWSPGPICSSHTLVNKSVTYPTRLETRTKESNMYASCRVENLKAQ